MWGINRLTGIFSSSAISSKAISFSTISVLTTPRLPELEYITVIGLILFITFKEVLSESKIWEKDLEGFFIIGIVPLSISFIAIIAYRIIDILAL